MPRNTELHIAIDRLDIQLDTLSINTSDWTAAQKRALAANARKVCREFYDLQREEQDGKTDSL